MNARALLIASLSLFGASQARAETFIVNSTADAVDSSPGDGSCATSSSTCTLRAAIQESNALVGKDTIRLGAATYTLSLSGPQEDAGATGDLDILDDTAIFGQGPSETTIDANGSDRVIDCGPHPYVHELEMAGLRLTDGYEFTGGGLRTACRTELRELTITGNYGSAGGGIQVEEYWGTEPTLSLLRVELSGNEALSGGAISSTGEAPVTIRHSVITENTAQLAAAGIDGGVGLITIEGTLFAENASLMAPAIRGFDMTIHASTFATHDAGVSSGTVLTSGDVEISNSTFFENWAPLGGAVSVGGSGQVQLNNVTFHENWAFDETYADTTGASLSGTSDGNFTVSNTLFESETPSACSSYVGTVSLGFNDVEDDSCDFTSTGDQQNDPNIDLDFILGDFGGPTPTLELLDYGKAIDYGNPAAPGSVAGASEPVDQRYVNRPLRGKQFGTLRADIGATEHCAANALDSSTDSDWDGVADACDDDDDGDGCYDPFDSEPLTSVQPAGKIVHFCGSDDVYYAFEGSDYDGDGLMNCEDDNDDGDEYLDQDDPCPVDVLPVCLKPGVYPCLPRWLECLGGSCVMSFLRFYELVNPDPTRELRFDNFEIWNETIFIQPLAGQTAGQSIAQFASNAPQMNARSAGITAAAAPRRLSGRVRIEMWSKRTRTRPERLLAVVGEYDAGRVRLGSLNTGNVIVLEPPVDSRSPLGARTNWVKGAMSAKDLADLDADGLPSSFDNCVFTPNADQRDSNQNGLGDPCEIASHGR